MSDLELLQALLPREQEHLSEDRELYLECLNNKPLSERKTEIEIRDGLILYWHVYQVCRKNNL